MRKPNSNAVLKTLPDERQADIADYSREHSLAQTVAWLQADGIKTSSGPLSQFLSWYSLRQQFAQDEQTSQTLIEQLKKEIPGLTEEQLDELGQRTFSLLSIRRQDLDGFVTVRSARSRAELERAKLKLREQAEARLAGQAKLAREKFQFDAAKAALKCAAELKVISASKLSQADKVNQARLKLFGELPE